MVEMQDGLDFIMRPVLRHMCQYESLLNGTLRMVDLARLNDAIDVLDENERRLTPKE